MFQPFSLYVGLRYLRAKRRNHFISFISLISMLGIALGVMTLITVISVMNGFEQELRDRILGMISHATIEPYESNLEDWSSVVAASLENPEVIAAAPYIERETFLIGSRNSGALVRGVVPDLETGVSDVATALRSGSIDDLAPGEYNIILGASLAANLGVTVGEKVTVLAPQVSATPVGAVPPMKRFTVSGLFEAGVYEYDSALALIHVEDAQKLFRFTSGVAGIRLKLKDIYQAWNTARDLATDLEGVYRVRDWSQRHANFFQAVRTEKAVMFVILSLIVAVAAFNIISTLVMVVTDKQSDIAILKTMGASPRTVMGIFMVQGSFIGVIGTALGVVGGILLATNVETIVPWLEQLFNKDFLQADVYYISDLPSELRSADVIKFALLSLVMALLSTLYPAWRASRVHPAEALRYE